MPRPLVLAPEPVDASEPVCPICGAAGPAPCEEEDGQYVLDHHGRPGSAWPVDTRTEAA